MQMHGHRMMHRLAFPSITRPLGISDPIVMWENPVVGTPTIALRFRCQRNLFVPIPPGCITRPSPPLADPTPSAPVSPAHSGATIPIFREDQAAAPALLSESSEDLYSPQEEVSPAHNPRCLGCGTVESSDFDEASRRLNI